MIAIKMIDDFMEYREIEWPLGSVNGDVTMGKVALGEKVALSGKVLLTVNEFVFVKQGKGSIKWIKKVIGSSKIENSPVLRFVKPETRGPNMDCVNSKIKIEWNKIWAYMLLEINAEAEHCINETSMNETDNRVSRSEE